MRSGYMTFAATRLNNRLDGAGWRSLVSNRPSGATASLSSVYSAGCHVDSTGARSLSCPFPSASGSTSNMCSPPVESTCSHVRGTTVTPYRTADHPRFSSFPPESAKPRNPAQSRARSPPRLPGSLYNY